MGSFSTDFTPLDFCESLAVESPRLRPLPATAAKPVDWALTGNARPRFRALQNIVFSRCLPARRCIEQANNVNRDHISLACASQIDRGLTESNEPAVVDEEFPIVQGFAIQRKGHAQFLNIPKNIRKLKLFLWRCIDFISANLVLGLDEERVAARMADLAGVESAAERTFISSTNSK